MKAQRRGTARSNAKKVAERRASNESSEASKATELRELDVLDTSPETAFDELTLLASHVSEAPMALISFVDEGRQGFKSRVGLDQSETERLLAFCAHTIKHTNIFVVPDASVDKRFRDCPLVSGAPFIRFYAGIPLVTSSGHTIGTLCVFDTAARKLKREQEHALRVLGRQVVMQIELRQTDARRRSAEVALKEANARLERAIEERTVELQKARSEAIATRREIVQVIERVSDGLVALDRDWHYTYVNEKAAELFGRRPEDLLGKHIWTEFPEGIGQPFHLAYCRAIAEQKPISLQAYYEPWDRWFENRIYPSENGVSIFFQEITEKKRTEERLQREMNLSNAVIACLPGIFYVFDEEGRFAHWNKRAEDATGLTSEQFGNTHPLDLILPADRAAVERGIAKTFTEGESTTEARILSTNGTSTWYLCTGSRVMLDGKVCLVGLAVDISERKRAEELLRDAQTRLEVAVRASGVGLWDWDLVNDCAYVSPEWRAQFGFAESELKHAFSIWESRLHPDDRARAVSQLKEYLENPSAEYQAESRVSDNDGVYRWIFTRAQLLRDEKGRPIRMLGCHIDVTEHRRTEERLLSQREQLRALAKHLNSVREEEAGRIARELHDELGSALTGLKIDVNRLGQRLAKDTVEAQRTQIQSILSSIDVTIRSVRKICLDLRPGVLDQLGLTAAVEWLVTEFQNRTGIACKLHQPESISLEPECTTAIFRILQELLTNIARHAGATKAAIELRRETDNVVLEVHDNGRGLPEDALTHPDRFGLLGVRERALAAGGNVDFHSTRTSGTRVVVCIPIE